MGILMQVTHFPNPSILVTSTKRNQECCLILHTFLDEGSRHHMQKLNSIEDRAAHLSLSPT